VCPDGPQPVLNPDDFEQYRTVRVDETFDIRTVRYNIASDGTIFGYEGPQNVDESEYDIVRTEHPESGYTHVFMKPKTPPKTLSREEVKDPVAWPFRPVKGHPFGIDSAGRDVYSRVVHGLRIGLLFGFVLTFWAMFGGVVIGSIEGYFGGVVDICFQRFTEIWSTLPFLYIMVFIGATLGRSFTTLLICYALFNWILVSYYVRAEFLRLRSRPFVEAAKCQGLSAPRIIFKHVLPNALTPLVTLFPFLLMGAIGSLAALDFLGFGLPALTPSLGELLNEAQQFRWAWWLVVFPGGTLFLVMFLAVLIGEGLRDAFDPRRKSHLE
ncbi:MAG: ABC transporter permease, partial [Kiritimatiellae bacterium]|nr:ABC transporter permease [Kiritimatiellia bacterium]